MPPFPKNIRMREKIGDLTMKANFIKNVINWQSESYICQNPMKGGVGFYWKKRNIPPPVTPPFFRQKFFFRIF